MRTLSLIAAVVCLMAVLTYGQDQILPAGTLLRCTIDEPRVSSKTLEVGDPVLCHLGYVSLFGSPAFPRGAYLGGRLDEFRDPGHFFGKGWFRLSFDRIVLPGQSLPISAKVSSAPPLRVDRKGDIHGRGHPKRDFVEWMLPPLWPVKVLTLPLRGPRPMLRGERPIMLRLMDDVVLPGSAPKIAPLVPRPPSNLVPSQLQYGEVPKPPVRNLLQAVRLQTELPTLPEPVEAAANQTVLVLKDGSAYVANDYWLDEGGMRLLMPNGDSRLVAVGNIDLKTTTDLNRQRGIRFVLKSMPAVPEQ